jgi:hypothetical protein
MEPLFTVEEPGERRMEVYDTYIISVDYYEGFAEITFVEV